VECRIEGDDSVMSAIMKITEGNLGALSVCSQLVKGYEGIAPGPLMCNGFWYVMTLDSYGIYGSRVWMLYNDLCKRCLVRTALLLHALAGGFITIELLNYGIDTRGAGIDFGGLHEKVKAENPAFAELPKIE
jgi:hypothetical protein